MFSSSIKKKVSRQKTSPKRLIWRVWHQSLLPIAKLILVPMIIIVDQDSKSHFEVFEIIRFNDLPINEICPFDP